MKILSLATPLCIAVLVTACGGSDKKKPPKMNTPPLAVSGSITTQADTQFVGKLKGIDVDKDALTFVIFTASTNGTVTLKSDGSFTYLPKADTTGMDQFAFTVSDGKGTSNPARVNITIDLLAVNMGAYTRKAFKQMEDDVALSLNTRVITQDVTDENAFDDLLAQ